MTSVPRTRTLTSRIPTLIFRGREQWLSLDTDGKPVLVQSRLRPDQSGTDMNSLRRTLTQVREGLPK